MTLLQSILLGILQGLTEFLPISSSGHLVIVPYLLHWDIPAEEAFVFNVLVQVATLLAVFAYFFQDLLLIFRAMLLGLQSKKPLEDPLARLGWLLILATIPAGMLGLVLKNSIENVFAHPTTTAAFLLVTACLLVFAEKVGKRDRGLHDLTWKDALWIGFSQVLAIFPGISRSGATIAGGMIRHLERPGAARFVFLMSIPILLAAGFSAGLDWLNAPNTKALLPVYLPGFLAAAVMGYLSIRWLMRFLSSRPLYIFSAYCAALGFLVFVVSLSR